MTRLRDTPEALGMPSESYGALLAPIIMKQLPQELCVIISREVGVESWDLDKMMSIVEKEVEARERTCANIGTPNAQGGN